MIVPKKTITSIDEYNKLFPEHIQIILEHIRKIIKECAPKAQETIKYQMPTYTLHGNLVHFAAYKSHIGLYPTPGPIVEFQKELAKYKHAKGSIQFPIHKEIPYTLIKKIIQYRVQENITKN